MDNGEKLTTYGTQDEGKQNKASTKYVFDTTMHKQTKSTHVTQVWERMTLVLMYYIIYKT